MATRTYSGPLSFVGSAAFTGVVTAPTPTAGDNSTKVATTAFVTAAIAAVGGISLGGNNAWTGNNTFTGIIGSGNSWPLKITGGNPSVGPGKAEVWGQLSISTAHAWGSFPDYGAGSLYVDKAVIARNVNFIGTSTDSGNSYLDYAMYQESGAWTHPYPDLAINYHTGIKIRASSNYGGIRMYTPSTIGSASPDAGLTLSVGEAGDNYIRMYGNLFFMSGQEIRANTGYVINIRSGINRTTNDHIIFYAADTEIGRFTTNGMFLARYGAQIDSLSLLLPNANESIKIGAGYAKASQHEYIKLYNATDGQDWSFYRPAGTRDLVFYSNSNTFKLGWGGSATLAGDMTIGGAQGANAALMAWGGTAMVNILNQNGTVWGSLQTGGLRALTAGLYMANTGSPAIPVGGGVLYVESGILKYKNASGGVTGIAS